MALLAPVVDPVKEHRTLPAADVLVRDPALLGTLGDPERGLYAEMAVVQSEENWNRFRRAALPGILASDLRAVARLGRQYALPEPPDRRLNGFERPVLIVAGKQDAVVGYKDQRALARRFPHATYAELEGAGHNVHLDQPGIVQALLADWAYRIKRG